MAFRNISVALIANDAGLTSTVRRASSTVDEFGRRTQSAGKTVTRAGNEMTGAMTKLETVLGHVTGRAMAAFTIRALGVYAAGRAVNDALQSVVGGAVQFDARMRNVNSISNLSQQQFTSLSSQVLDLSRVLPQSANTLAEGLYNIASSGFQGAAGLQVLDASARAATAGLTDTSTSAAAIAGVLNAYGEGAGQAKAVSDSLFQTVNVGVLSFNDLAQGIGQVVGTAAAAGVSIDQVGAAIATMTRAGVVPAEAFTSLNQVLAQLIQPGQAMQAVFDQLGYTSGAAALQAKGLAGVMADIRTVTGGSITSMSQLFTDIRALRGALALGTNQGQLYVDSLKAQAAAHDGVGQTAKTLAEQLKSVSAQWQLFKNRIQAAAIEAGTRLLPTLLALMRGSGAFAHDVGGLAAAVAPTFHNISDAAASTLKVVSSLASAVLPLVKVFAILATTALIGTLQALSAALAAVTGFVERHRSAQVALAVVITAMVLPALQAMIVRMAWFTGNAVAAGILRILGAFTALGGGLTAVRAALTGFLSTSVGLSSVLGGVFAGAAILAGVALYGLQRQAARTHAETEKMTAGFDPSKFTQGAQMIDNLSSALDIATKHFNDLNRLQRGLGHFGFGPGAGDLAGINGASDAISNMQDQLLSTLRNANRLGSEFHVLGQTVLDYAAKNNIDLSKPWDQNSAAIEQVRQGLQGLAAQAGVSLPQLSSLTGGDVDAMQSLATAVQKATDAVGQSFASAFDVIQQFKPDQGAAAVTAAQKKMLSAQQGLRDEQARYDAQKKHSVSSDQQLAKAHRDVAAAATALSAAQAGAAKTGDLSTIYRNNITMGRRFIDEINTAGQRGLDPQFIARLLQAGPEQAGPILDALVQGHGARMIRLANAAERTLSAISARAVEMARLTALAMNSATDELGRDLPHAMAVAQSLATQGAKATAASIAAAVHLSPSEIQRIAAEFGITLPKAIQTQLDAHPIHLSVDTHGDLTVNGKVAAHKAAGGLLTGPGSGTSDSIVARVSNGEFVQRAAAVNFYGVDFMRRLNQMQVPRYATGGMIGTTTTRPAATAAGGTRVIVVEKNSSVDRSSPITIGTVVAANYDDYQRKLARARRIRAAVS